MNYAIPTNPSFFGGRTLPQKRQLPESARLRKEFYKSHDVSVFIKDDGSCHVTVTEKVVSKV